MLLSEKISSSESKYLKILEDFFNRIFDASFLPSHGISHHRRVWHYVKEIIQDPDVHDFEPDENFTDKLIIASFLHDSGMSVDRGIRHGAESRNFCEKFLIELDLSILKFYDVLDAVENHDNKNYTSINQPWDLLTILSVADDLDAFGFIGIYRYLEIYISRNIQLNELGELITGNIEARFQNFLRTYGSCKDLIEKHSKRYEVIDSFFNLYNQQVPFHRFDDQAVTGYCGVAEIIRERLNNGPSDKRFVTSPVNFPDPVIQWFFNELNNESESFK
jgi:HD superfamily phosphodiesterase